MSNAPFPPSRGASATRRLRLRRQQARVRLLLIGDFAVLARHHASEVSQVPRGDRARDADLRGDLELRRRELHELRAQIRAPSARSNGPAATQTDPEEFPRREVVAIIPGAMADSSTHASRIPAEDAVPRPLKTCPTRPLRSAARI